MKVGFRDEMARLAVRPITAAKAAAGEPHRCARDDDYREQPQGCPSQQVVLLRVQSDDSHNREVRWLKTFSANLGLVVG